MRKTARTTRRLPPRAMSLVEVVAAATILAVVVMLSVKMLGALAEQHQSQQHRQAAIRAAGNVMERLFAEPFESCTAEAVDAGQFSQPLQETLPGGRVEIEITALDTPPPAKRVSVAVSWPQRDDRPRRIERLVAWRYDLGDADQHGEIETGTPLTTEEQ